MFSNLNKPAFGTSTTTPSFGFGNTAAPNQTPFGQSQLFGKPATTGFGTATPLFGANTQQPAPSLFGTPGSTFGAPTQQSGFGTTGLFGQQQNVATGNTLFGSTNTSAFGQQNKPTGFGFGSTATPLFGQQQTQAFQPSTSSGLFGASNAFGGSAQMGTVVKFNPVTGTDTMQKSGITHSISTKHHCITCMKEYESKSLEELRWEDYQCNRKGPQQQPGGFGGFGTPASTAPSLFGGVTDNKSAFGQMNTFASSSSGFGLTSQANQASIFGKPAAGFGTQTTPSFGFNTTSSAFGNTATVKPFGAAPTQNVFGTTTTQPTGFGTSLFGQPSTQTTTGTFFNKPAQPTFSTQQPMFTFGQSAPTTQSNFFQQAKPSTGFGTFGQTSLTTTPGFGQQTSLFSQPAQNPFNTFQKPAQPAFGQQLQPSFGLGTQQQAGTNLFGNANKPLFGNTTQGNFFTPAAGGFMMPQQQQTIGLTTGADAQLDFNTMVERVYEPFPRYSFMDDLAISKPACHNTTNPIVLKEIMDNATLPLSPTNDISKYRVMHACKSAVKEPKFSMLDDVVNTPNATTWNGKRLILNKWLENEEPEKKDTSKATKEISPRIGREIFANNLDETSTGRKERARNITNNNDWYSRDEHTQYGVLTSPNIGAGKINKQFSERSPTENQQMKNNNTLYPRLFSPELGLDMETPTSKATNFDTKNNNSIELLKENLENDVNIGTPTRKEGTNPRAVRFVDESEQTNPELIEIPDSNDNEIDTCGIKLERPEYYTVPPLNEIHKFKDENGTCIIKGFTIGRVGYGNIYFPDAMDVSNLDLDEIVHIRYREVIVYTDDNNKPPVGEGLNRPAQVTIDRVWPRDPESKQMIKDATEINKNNFVERLAAISEKQNAKFVDYRPETGSWVFTVEHFSKYKYIEDADDEATNETEKSFQNLEIKKSEEKKQPEVQQDIEVSFEPIKQGLGGLHHHIDHPLEESVSFIRSFSKPLRMPESKSVVIMKSTFFDEESVSDDVSSSEIAAQHFGMPVVEDVTLLQQRKPRITKPKQYALYSFPRLIPFENSLLTLPNYMDMQVFQGRSFKVGWGCGLTLMALPGVGGISEVTDDDTLPNTVMHLDVSCLSDETDMVNIEDYMKVILSECAIAVDEIGVPTCSINQGSKCLENLKSVTNANSRCYKEVWDLCLAFWGPNATTVTEHNELFSEWLENVSLPYVTAELESSNTKSAILKNIYTHLTGHQIEAAASLAMEAGFPRLAVLIPACVNNTSRLLIYNQLHVWKETGTLNHISKDLIKIYMLLGGIPVTSDINICESLDWKRSLAIHFWYMSPPGISLTSSLQTYQDAFSFTGYACRPNPAYYKAKDDSADDVLYNIMFLFASGSLPLHKVLNPATYSENPLDFRLSWFLLQVFTALNVGNISEHVYDYICISFSSQLEHLHLWQWAVFVLLFIKNKSVKHNMVMSILDRNLDSSRSTRNISIEDFLVNDIKISPTWIHSTLAQKTALLDNHLETFQHLILANDYGKAHAIAVKHLIPKFIKTRQLDLLTKLLKDLLPGRTVIWQWNTQAGFILDFLEIYHKVTNFKDELSDFDRRNIKSALNALCLRMKEFPLESPHQSKALAKIGQFIAELVIIVYCELESDPKNKETASNLIKTLVMPYDYIHNELEKLANK